MYELSLQVHAEQGEEIPLLNLNQFVISLQRGRGEGRGRGREGGKEEGGRKRGRGERGRETLM